MAPRTDIDDEQGGADPFESLVLPLLRGWHWLILGAIAGCGIGGAIALNQPNTFESAAKLPRRQQQKIAEAVQALVAQHANGNGKPA